uniref:Uncharacterized protein n=1 Tax=Arundo donax TaxID=35708 RepID=A0A0A9BC98_ARUDO
MSVGSSPTITCSSIP